MPNIKVLVVIRSLTVVGNSLGVTIPGAFLRDLKLKKGNLIQMNILKNKIVIKKLVFTNRIKVGV